MNIVSVCVAVPTSWETNMLTLYVYPNLTRILITRNKGELMIIQNGNSSTSAHQPSLRWSRSVNLRSIQFEQNKHKFVLEAVWLEPTMTKMIRNTSIMCQEI